MRRLSEFLTDTHPAEKPTQDLLDTYIQITELVPIPLCLIDQKGFLLYVNDELLDQVEVSPINGDFPFIGRYLAESDMDRIRTTIDKVNASEEKIQVQIDCSWHIDFINKETIRKDLNWTMIGSKKHKVFVVCGYPGKSKTLTVFKLEENIPPKPVVQPAHNEFYDEYDGEDHPELDDAELALKIHKYKEAREEERIRHAQIQNGLHEQEIALCAMSKWESFNSRIDKLSPKFSTKIEHTESCKSF